LIFEPPPLPDLPPEAELAILVRALEAEGYDDHLAGHVTYACSPDTFLIDPFELSWGEVRASDIVKMDCNAHKIAGRYNVTPAAELHVEVRKRRPDAVVIVHNHPRWATVWADLGRVPPIHDQTSAQVSHELHLIDEWGGAEDNRSAAADLVGNASWALLRNHGVLVIGSSIAEAYLRCFTLEWRCRRAWEVVVAGGAAPVDAELAKRFGRKFEVNAVLRWWESAVRGVLRRDSSVLS
jgi:ribulose-5-phosphate 4-epimerase/fuculose-1-phosphate aldolase